MQSLIKYIPIILAILSIDLGGKGKGNNSENKGRLSIGTVVLIIAFWYYLQSTWNATVKAEESKNVSDPNVLLAQKIRIACMPWGWDWSIDIDNYDQQSLLNSASEIKTKKQFDDVVTSYQRQFSEDMVQRLQKEMGSNYTLFIGALGFNKTPTTKKPINKGDKVFASVACVGYDSKNSKNVSENFTAGDEVGIYQGSQSDIVSAKTKIKYALVQNIGIIYNTLIYVDKSKLYIK
jgi:hypothetical protein